MNEKRPVVNSKVIEIFHDSLLYLSAIITTTHQEFGAGMSHAPILTIRGKCKDKNTFRFTPLNQEQISTIAASASENCYILLYKNGLLEWLTIDDPSALGGRVNKTQINRHGVFKGYIRLSESQTQTLIKQGVLDGHFYVNEEEAILARMRYFPPPFTKTQNLPPLTVLHNTQGRGAL